MRSSIFQLLFPFLLMMLSPALEAIHFEKQVRPILKKHCFKCHGEKKQKGDLRLDTLSGDLSKDRVAAEAWHDVQNALNLSEMPPKKEDSLLPAELRTVTSWITQEIDALVASQKGTGGRIVLRRLNKTDYQNTMRDLLGIEMDYAKNLPPETLSEDGFRNNGATLQMSDLQLEYYLESARKGLAKAIVTGSRPKFFEKEFTVSVNDKNRGSNILDKDQQFIAKLLDYPEDGEILIRAKVKAQFAENRGYPQLRAAIGYRADVQAPRGFLKPVDITSEDWQIIEFRARIENFPLPSKSQSKFPGLLLWLDNAYAEGHDKPIKTRGKGKKKKAQKGPLTYPRIEVASMQFIGPILDDWPPAQHKAILLPSEQRSNEETYSKIVIRNFMRRAFRRPIHDEEIVPYYRFFRSTRPEMETFEDAIRETLAMVLISPDFLFLVEPSGSSKRSISDWELASRLSYFLWSSMPDTRLLNLAKKEALRKPEILEKEISRMISDERSWQFVEQFADQWLDIGALQRVAINPNYYPKFDPTLKASMRGETIHFFGELFQKNLSALNILDSNFTMLDEPLAKHYGLAGPKGSRFERVSIKPGDHRGGVLAHGSVLLGNSTGEDSHPVKRAVWIRERLLNDAPAPPPPDVPALDSTDPNFATLSVRDQLAEHRKQISCNECHRNIDPWGISLENFGADGLWREQILRKKVKGKGMIKLPVLSEAILPDGKKIEGIADLKKHLLEDRREQFARAFTSKLLTYALGRRLELIDQKTVDELTSKFIKSDYRIKDLIYLIVASKTFQSK
ncbi:MAG: DUF1592 domain-containing protein [Akkermansiaceae bacterium]|nr:DUF1592 domain-containing protein [Akkermansiaceae bacterium]